MTMKEELLFHEMYEEFLVFFGTLTCECERAEPLVLFTLTE